MNRTTPAYGIAALAVVAVLTCGWLRTSTAAEDKSPPSKLAEPSAESKPTAPEPPSELRVYALRAADPQTVLSVVQTLLAGNPGVRVTLDPKNSTLIMMASPEAHQKVGTLLRQLDVPRETQIKVFTLVDADPVSAAKVLAKICPKGVQIAIDERSNSLIVSGAPDDLRVAEAVTKRLDEQVSKELPKPSATYEVRIVWLASPYPSGGDPVAGPGDDLKNVVAELSRLGIRNPYQVGQMVVRAASGHNFNVKSLPLFGGHSADFTASGMLLEQYDGSLEMDIRINARQMSSAKEKEQDLADLDTRIVLPQKQYVVLGTAPVGHVTSAFVVQVTGATKTSGVK